MQEASARGLVVTPSITKLPPETPGAVVIAGSHGGVYAGYLAAKGAALAVVLNDAGVGLDQAGIGSLAWLARLGMAAATADHRSCRIGDGADMLRRGRISHANEGAVRLGVAQGMPVAEAAELFRAAPAWTASVPDYAESRFLLREGAIPVWGIDSVSLVRPEDRGCVLVTGSHGGILAGNPATALGAEVRGALFNDAGIGADEAGIGRLPVLDQRGIPGAVLDCRTCRIGDARSAWASGRVSRLNQAARVLGLREGQGARDFADLIIRKAGS